MSKKIEKIIQKILNLGKNLDLRSRLFKKYKKQCYGVMDWVLLSRESKIKAIEDMKNNSIKEGAHFFQACFTNKTPEFYVDHIDSIIAYADKEKIKLRAVEEGITVMIPSIALAEEIQFLNYENRNSTLLRLRERLRKEEKYGIPLEKCFEEILNIREKINS